MRNWIDAIENAAEAPLDEGKLGPLATAAAMASVAANQYMSEPANAIEYDLGAQSEYAASASYAEPDESDPVISDPKVEAPKVDEEQVKLLALTMWGEARSEGPQAMRAVGHVVMNRLASKRNFGDTVKAVVWKRKAFSCWNKGDPNLAAMKKIASLPKQHAGRRAYERALVLARKIIAGEDQDITNGALFYHTKSISPVWKPDADPVADMGSHVFYDVDKKA